MSSETTLPMTDLAGLALSRIDGVFEIARAHYAGFGSATGKTRLFLALGKTSAHLIGFTRTHVS